MARELRHDTDWIVLPGRSLAEIEALAIRAAFFRHNGDLRKMRGELRISKSSLWRKLTKLGLHRRRDGRRLTEGDLARAFFRHCQSIAVELSIHDSTLLKWINKRAPFAVEE